MNSKYTSSQAESLLDVVNSLSTTHYTQSEVDALIGNLHNVHTSIVTELPETGDSNIIYLISKGSSGTTGNLYNEYVYINGAYECVGDFGVSLTGYVTTEQLNNAGYLTSHQDISGKADKSDTYTKTEVDTLLNNLSFIDTEIVTELPTENINTLCMYFVPVANGAGETNHYDEFMYINNQWEQMGSTKCECNMSDYEKKAWIGTTEEFNALTSKDSDRLYLITDGTTGTQVIDLSTYETSAHAAETYQPKGEYLTSYTETDPVFVASAAHGITSTDIANWNAKSTFDGNYNNLTNKPTIPSIEGLATTEQLDRKSDTGHTHTVSEITDYQAPVTYEAGTGIDITDGVISCTVEGGSNGVSQEAFDSATQAIAKSLYDLEKVEERLQAHVDRDYYNKTSADAKFIDNAELETKLVDFMQSSAYHAVHDPQEQAIAKSLVTLDGRITELEENSSTYDDTEIRSLIAGKQDAGNYLTQHQSLSNYYTQEQVNNLIAAISEINISIVTELPTEAEPRTIYFLPKTTSEEQNVYDEYMYINDAWEKIGDTKVDLTDYVKKEELPTNVVGGTAAYTITKLTQDEYDALETKDENTIYFIS